MYDPSRVVAVATNFVGKIDLPSTACTSVVRMTFARAAPPAYDKKGTCYMQANEMPDSMDAGEPIN